MATTMVRSVLNSPSPNRAMAQTISASQFKARCPGLMPRVDSTPLPTSRERLRTAWDKGLVVVCALSFRKQGRPVGDTVWRRCHWPKPLRP